MSRALRIARISLTSANARGLSEFYQRALGFRVVDEFRCDRDASLAMMGVAAGARIQRLQVGDESVEFVQFDVAGRPYPSDATAADLLFQHFALVVADMDAAYERLASVPGWRPISEGGPQTLPASSGGVTAFKFRDPEGHPLELIAFAKDAVPPHWARAAGDDLCLGIDHTAIDVADVARSVAFYGALGFAPAGGSINRGPAQQRLDGVISPDVEVAALALGPAPPHLELLGYRSPRPSAHAATGDNDIAATRIVLAMGPAAATRFVVDPDGHRLSLIGGQ